MLTRSVVGLNILSRGGWSCHIHSHRYSAPAGVPVGKAKHPQELQRVARLRRS
jgi:hypothetical protein